MYYHVVARPCAPTGVWEYYPYWAPIRDKEAAMRLANYAAQSGYEAAILQSVAAQTLQEIAQGVVDRQESHRLPALRFMPGALAPAASGRHEREGETRDQLLDDVHWSTDGASKAELDQRRIALETGRGGDVVERPEWTQQPISFPQRVDVLRRWITLRGRLLAGQLGGAADGAGDISEATDDE